jgi:hypothetical protein
MGQSALGAGGREFESRRPDQTSVDSKRLVDPLSILFAFPLP